MKKATVLGAIQGTGGIMSTIAKRMGCDWHTAAKWVNKWPDTIQALNAEKEGILDLAEGTIYTSIKGGNTQDAKWLLAMQAKNRGYVERKEVTQLSDLPEIVIEVHPDAK